MTLILKDLQQTDKPRERLLKKGVSSLSDMELLALILGSGGEKASVLQISAGLLKEFNGIPGLVKADINKLMEFRNIGPAKASAIKAACEIGQRAISSDNVSGIYIRKPQDIFNYLKVNFYDKEKEHLYIISLNSKNKVISKDLVSIGTLNETLVHPREVYRIALIKNAAFIILVHNHPSGDASPSDDDITVTERIARAGMNIGIPLLDHVVMTDSGYTSLRSLNLLKKLKKERR